MKKRIQARQAERRSDDRNESEGTRARQNRRVATRRVGILYLVGDKLWIEATSVAHAGNLGDYAYHERQHEQYWRLLMKQGAVPNTEYTEFPRGRVSYNRKTAKFELLADRCILQQRALVSVIFSRMRLAVQGTRTSTDAAYRCLGCGKAWTSKWLKLVSPQKGCFRRGRKLLNLLV